MIVDVDLTHDSFILVYIVGTVPVYTAQAGITMMVLVWLLKLSLQSYRLQF